MKIAIYGAGSIGTILGAFITKNGIDIDLISRNKEHTEGLKTNGARVVGTIEMTVPVKALLPEDISKKYDIVFLLTKTVDNSATVKNIVPHLADDGVICTLQNGLPEKLVAEIIGEDRTFGCTIAWGATFIGNGVCELTSEPDSISFSLGTLSPNPDVQKMKVIQEILETMGKVEVEANFLGARWSKILINSAFSGMSAVLGCTFGEAAKNKESRKCIQRIIKECIDVAQKAGIKIEPVQGKDISKLLNYQTRVKEYISFLIIPIAIKKHRNLKASMLQDLERGKKTEVDEINGIVCSYGKIYHCPTPYNDTVVNLIHEIEEGKIQPGFGNLQRFKEL